MTISHRRRPSTQWARTAALAALLLLPTANVQADLFGSIVNGIGNVTKTIPGDVGSILGAPFGLHQGRYGSGIGRRGGAVP